MRHRSRARQERACDHQGRGFMKQVGSDDGQLDEAELGSPLHKKVPLPRPFSPNGRATNGTSAEKPLRGDGSDSKGGSSATRRPTVVMLVEDDESLPDRDRIKAATLRPRWLRDVLGELPVEEPYPVKERALVYDFDRTFSFLFGMAYTWRAPYWFLSMVWAQVVLGICMGVGGHYAQTLHPRTFKVEPDVSKVHGFLGAILSFLIVFRSNAAYDRYYDGRKMLGMACNSVRDLITELYATVPADPKDGPRIYEIAEQIRRKLNVLFALMRQNARESVAGFCPSSSLSKEPFNGDTWYRDPQRPRLYDMLTDTERSVYSKYTPGSRSQVCAYEIKVLISEIAQIAQVPLWVLDRGHRHIEDIMTAEAALTRIRDTPVPFPYVYIMNVLTFVFIYATPFIYNADMASKAAATSLLAAAYYGCSAIGLQLENPFGWEAVDIDLEAFCMSIHDQTRSVAAFALGEDGVASYLPDSLRNLRKATVVEAMRRTMSMALLPNLPTSGPNTPSHSTDVQHT